jgi:hypothetical protein
VGIKTLEIDLCKKGYGDEFLDTIRQLGAGKKRLERFEKAIKNGIKHIIDKL